jgi:hypothetical protein
MNKEGARILVGSLVIRYRAVYNRILSRAEFR